MYTALVVDDEPQMTAIVEFALRTKDFAVHVAHDAATALNLLRHQEVDLVVLDVLMPAIDGLALCERIRARSDVPIMLLTALTQQEDVITGLERGADDYVTKPFNPHEVALRAHALARRGRGGKTAPLRVGGLVIDHAGHGVTVAGRPLHLPYTEFKLLAHLAKHCGVPQSWRDLLRAVWGTADAPGGQDMVKSAVYRLRARLAPLKATGYVRTIHGVGYLMPEDPHE
ncbi:DNA-binding response regulator [Spongiactinospora rosea]|uniref:DNA-binding response regulator n=1 Tax=Spongiactinospora rosea TaxID=2248750 RepID=A0A366LPF1_9ACTN|nr:response regulator transcription factor [Spongiactinospora rosea]RBQ15052.1 DNA-binding response regulator [Spongiactinospora rosea]